MSKTKALYHIVFCTKGRERTLIPEARHKVYALITSMVLERKCVMYRIGGIANHIHIFIDLNPSVALATLMMDIKSQTSFVIKREKISPIFRGWASGYYGCTISPGHGDKLIEYIDSQESHHKEHDFNHEIEWLYKRAGLTYYHDDMT